MKKFLAVFLVLTCIFAFGACAKKGNANDENSNDVKLEKAITGNEIYFIAKFVGLQETTMVVEVTDKGNSSVSVGDEIIVSTEKILTALAENYVAVTDNYLCIEFDGNVIESSSLMLDTIYKIDVTDSKGYIIKY